MDKPLETRIIKLLPEQLATLRSKAAATGIALPGATGQFENGDVVVGYVYNPTTDELTLTGLKKKSFKAKVAGWDTIFNKISEKITESV